MADDEDNHWWCYGGREISVWGYLTEVLTMPTTVISIPVLTKPGNSGTCEVDRCKHLERHPQRRIRQVDEAVFPAFPLGPKHSKFSVGADQGWKIPRDSDWSRTHDPFDRHSEELTTTPVEPAAERT